MQKHCFVICSKKLHNVDLVFLQQVAAVKNRGADIRNNTSACIAAMLPVLLGFYCQLKRGLFQHRYIKLIQLNPLAYILSFTRQPWLEWHQSHYQELGIWVLPSRARTSSP